jgi:hypothetical protein
MTDVSMMLFVCGYLLLALALVAEEGAETTKTREMWKRVARVARVFIWIVRLLAGLSSPHGYPGADLSLKPNDF